MLRNITLWNFWVLLEIGLNARVSDFLRPAEWDNSTVRVVADSTLYQITACEFAKILRFKFKPLLCTDLTNLPVVYRWLQFPGMTSRHSSNITEWALLFVVLILVTRYIIRWHYCYNIILMSRRGTYQSFDCCHRSLRFRAFVIKRPLKATPDQSQKWTH